MQVKLIAICIAAIAASGCVSNSSQFVNQATGKTGYCTASGYGLIGSIVASSAYESCRQRALAAGYSEQVK